MDELRIEACQHIMDELRIEVSLRPDQWVRIKGIIVDYSVRQQFANWRESAQANEILHTIDEHLRAADPNTPCAQHHPAPDC